MNDVLVDELLRNYYQSWSKKKIFFSKLFHEKFSPKPKKFNMNAFEIQKLEMK